MARTHVDQAVDLAAGVVQDIIELAQVDGAVDLAGIVYCCLTLRFDGVICSGDCSTILDGHYRHGVEKNAVVAADGAGQKGSCS